MKRGRLVLILSAFACAVMFMLSVSAAADGEMKRGDRGEGVREAQEWLIDLGYLDGEADGIFGKKTEAAVKAFQKTIGAKENGKLTVEQLDELSFLWMDATSATVADGPDEEDLKEIYPAGCCRTDDKPGAVDFCWRHFEAGRITAKLRMPGLPDKAVRLFADQAEPMWEEAVRGLYEEWAEENPEIAAEQLDIFETELKEQKEALAKEYGAESARAQQELVFWLEDVCVDRCFDLHTAEGNLR